MIANEMQMLLRHRDAVGAAVARETGAEVTDAGFDMVTEIAEMVYEMPDGTRIEMKLKVIA